MIAFQLLMVAGVPLTAAFYDKHVELKYVELSASCKDAVAVSGLLNVSSVAHCEVSFHSHILDDDGEFGVLDWGQHSIHLNHKLFHFLAG
jgi:RIO-like serine/threonine protein kinase